jgi:acetyltransferase-like isoleucine patch superfamily enzyme
MPVSKDVTLGNNVQIFHESLVNLYGCKIGDNTRIGTFVEIQKNVKIGKNCKLQSHSFICEGVTIEDEVFIGHGVMFINDKYPKSTNKDGVLQTSKDWNVTPIIVKKGASIGSGSIIMCGITIGQGAKVGAGAVVTNDIDPFTTVAGVPSRLIKKN